MFANKQRVTTWASLCLIVMLIGCSRTASRPETQTSAAARSVVTNQNTPAAMKDKIAKSDEDWKKELTPEQYQVLREKATERPFTGAFWNTHEAGLYRCAGCGQELFLSDSKFDSGCGWPSFDAPASKSGMEYREDNSHSMKRTEVVCARCGGHLGHLFDDGPKPTGMRYCINSAALKFEKKK